MPRSDTTKHPREKKGLSSTNARTRFSGACSHFVCILQHACPSCVEVLPGFE